MKMEQTECSETLAIKIHTPEKNPKENKRHSKQGENLKPRLILIVFHQKFRKALDLFNQAECMNLSHILE
jgi:hypothetical protein